MIFESFFGKLIGKKIGQKLNLQEGAMDGQTNEPKKKWYKSQTVWTAIVGILFNAYEGVATQLGPSLGVNLPPVPSFVATIINTVLGSAVIHGRIVASQKIG